MPDALQRGTVASGINPVRRRFAANILRSPPARAEALTARSWPTAASVSKGKPDRSIINATQCWTTELCAPPKTAKICLFTVADAVPKELSRSRAIACAATIATDNGQIESRRKSNYRYMTGRLAAQEYAACQSGKRAWILVGQEEYCSMRNEFTNCPEDSADT